jgi:hypothetical protein
MTAKSVPVKNIDERVAHIVHMIEKGREHPEIRKLAVQAISQRCGQRWCTPPGNDRAEINAIFRAAGSDPKRHEQILKGIFQDMKPRYRYCRDPIHRDLFQHPVRTLEFGGGDCDCATALFGSLAQSVGYPVRVGIIQTKGSPDWNHVYPVIGVPAEEPQKWVPMDLSMHHEKGPGWEAPKAMVLRVKDYEVPDE